MFRTQAEGNDSGRYTEGNPALGVPATVVGALEMNLIQEEICNVIEDAGIALSDSTEDQLLAAVKAILTRGGDQVNGSILDNQAVAVNLTGLLFDKTLVKSVRFILDVMRKNDATNATEVIDCFAIYNTASDAWALSYNGVGSDTGVSLSILATGQVNYTSTNYAGSNYVGSFRATAITKLAI